MPIRKNCAGRVHNYPYTATVLAIQASVSIDEFDATACYCGILIMDKLTRIQFGAFHIDKVCN